MEGNQELADLVRRFRDAASQQDPGWLQQQLNDLLGRGETAPPATRPTRRTRPPARLSSPATGGLRSRARRISASPHKGGQTIRSTVTAARSTPTAANTRRRGPGSRQVNKPADHVTQAAVRGRRGRKPAPPAAASASVTEDRQRAVSPSSPPGTSTGPSIKRVCALSQHAPSAVEGGGRGKEPAPQTAAARAEQRVGLSSSPHSQVITGPGIVEGWDSPQHRAGGRRGEKHAQKTAAAAAVRDDQHGELSPSPLPGATTADIHSSPREPVLMEAERGVQSIPCSPTHSTPSLTCSTPSPSTSARRRLSRVRPRTSPPVRNTDFTRPGRPAYMSTAGQAQGGRVSTAQIHHRESGERRVDTPTGRRGWRQEPTSASRSTVRGTRQGRDPITPTMERSPAPRNRSRSRSRDNSRRVRREHSHSSVRSSRRDVTAHAYSQEARVSRWERSSRSPSRSYSHREGHSCCHFSRRNSPRMSEREASQARSVTSKDGTRRRRSTSHDRVPPGTIPKQPPPKSNRMSSSLTAQGAATASGPGGGKTMVWLLGHSFISRARRRAAVLKGNALQLGFPEDRIAVKWFGFPGLQWSGVWPALVRLAKVEHRPDILVIHVGGNDLGLVAQRDLVIMMKQDVDRIRSLFPGIILVWSEITPRLVWRFARDIQAIERSRGKVNKLLSIFIRKSGGIVVRHRGLEDKTKGCFSTDGVHLSDIGMALFTFAIAEGIERALEFCLAVRGALKVSSARAGGGIMESRNQ
ncbi:serine/arginine repetitive matrix protein 2-like isoform X3 [Xenopus laevis]|uniref:1-alkyl-2-acetylglycerophosphocholine esterase n=1 Tax=Xenopus laevis TaxID=8355 RepID=A0A8J1MRM2_XENLA|nr:serine/arginine repetitive matrix protein 2-like isoform X3 [Xenopus laevis]